VEMKLPLAWDRPKMEHFFKAVGEATRPGWAPEGALVGRNARTQRRMCKKKENHKE